MLKSNYAYKQKDGTLTDAGYTNWYGPTLEEELLGKYPEVASEKTNELPQYDPANVEALADSPLQGKKIIFLGSSVTFGSNSNEVSFVEYLAARDGIEYVKEAVSGTTLVDNGDSSYIARMKANIPDQQADLFICQCKTLLAVTHIIPGACHSTSQLIHLFFRHIDNVKCKALSRLCPHSRKL